MEDLDRQLRQSAIDTCSQPAGSLARQRSLHQLIGRMQKSRKIWRDPSSHYEDALQQTWLYFCRNLCEALTGSVYDPDLASPITWFNAYLKRRLVDCRIEHNKQIAERVNPFPDDRDNPTDPLENIAAPSEPPPILKDVQEWVQQEAPRLRRIHVRDRPDIHAHLLILRRLPPETPWQDLAAELNASITTLSSFYQRECLPRLRDFGRSQGYL